MGDVRMMPILMSVPTSEASVDQRRIAVFPELPAGHMDETLGCLNEASVDLIAAVDTSLVAGLPIWRLSLRDQALMEKRRNTDP